MQVGDRIKYTDKWLKDYGKDEPPPQIQTAFGLSSYSEYRGVVTEIRKNPFVSDGPDIARVRWDHGLYSMSGISNFEKE